MTDLVIADPSVLNGRACIPRELTALALAAQEPPDPPLPEPSPVWGGDMGGCMDCGEPIDPEETVDLDYCAPCADFRAWYYGTQR